MSWSDAIHPLLTITDAAATADSSISSTGEHDKSKCSVLDIELNGNVASGIGTVKFDLNVGSSQTFAGGAPTWIVWRFGPTGGILQRSDGSAFAVAGLPAATNYRSVIAFCTDGVRVSNTTSWETFANAD